MYCQFKSNITLEPRLQEYIRKKKHYNNFNINPSISLEQEFNITHDDKKRIKIFLKSNQDLLKPHKSKEIPESKDLDAFFPSSFVKVEDPRMKNINIKKPEINVPENMGMFALDKDEKTCYPNELDIRKVSLKTHSRDLAEISETKDKNYDIISPPYNHEINTHNTRNNSSNSRLYKIPNIKYKHTLHHEIPVSTNKNKKTYNKNPENLDCHQKFHESAVKDIIGNIDTYGTFTSPEFSEIADMDKDYKLCIPNIRCNKKRDSKQDYKPMPYLGYKEGNRNIDLESDMQQGLPSRLFTQKAKSHGYLNPHEHFFDYISSDIQDPDHVVMPFPRGGYNTRLHNKHNKQESYEREVY